MNIGKNIKLYRNSLKMEQKDLAKLLCISDKTVSSWECGRTEPRMGMIERMCEIFGCGKLDLIDGNFTPEAHAIIDNIRTTVESLQPVRDTFMEEFQNDTVFMENMRLLWSLSPELKNEVYKCIQFQYYKLNEAAEEKRKLFRVIK